MDTIKSTKINIGSANPSQFVRTAYCNFSNAELVEKAIFDGEGILSDSGALLVNTGKHTGRSPLDKFIVDNPSITDDIWWEGNQSLPVEAFNRLLADFTDCLLNTTVYVQDLQARTGIGTYARVRMINSLSWHALFIRNLLINTGRSFVPEEEPDLTIINIPGFKADPVRHECCSETIISMDMERSLVLIGGTSYGGENKKSVFTYLNYDLPFHGILPMHCSASHLVGQPEKPSLFFGLSGTGKTTLSTDPSFVLVGDDEHGWSDDGIFNIEGGCYAKTHNLSPESEAEIHAATSRFGSVLENVIHEPGTRKPDFTDTTLTENTRCAYDIGAIPSASINGYAGHPENIFLLTCDAYGVLPPIARLTTEQAVEYFMMGYTSKVSGTERGIKEPVPVFSECFGKPFLPRPPFVYCQMFKERIATHNSKCWLINTGWTGGEYGKGSRIHLEHTRTLIHAVLSRELDYCEFTNDPIFNISIPNSVLNVPVHIVWPRNNWESQSNYDDVAHNMKNKFAHQLLCK